MLSHGQRISLNRAAGRLGMERTTLTRNLQPLLARGYVRLEAGDYARHRLIVLSQRGATAALPALPRWRQAQRSMAKHLTPTALDALAAAARAVGARRAAV